jgi:hypothetical protein
MAYVTLVNLCFVFFQNSGGEPLPARVFVRGIPVCCSVRWPDKYCLLYFLRACHSDFFVLTLVAVAFEASAVPKFPYDYFSKYYESSIFYFCPFCPSA